MKSFPRHSPLSGGPFDPTGRRARGPAALVLALGAFLAGAPFAAAQAPDDVATIAPEAPAAVAPLARALASVDPERVRADLEFISSDEMRGRDTPSQELRIAARYLRARLMHNGIGPGADGSYFHHYELSWRALDPARSLVDVTSERGTRTMTFGEDYFLPVARGVADLDLEGPVVWGGDLAGPALEELAVTGKWLLCTDAGAQAGRRRLAARRAGARGLIEMPAADYAGKPYAERFGRTTETVLRGTLSPGGLRPDGEREVFAHLALSREAGLALLGLSPSAPPDGAADWVPEAGVELGITLTEQRRTAGDSGAVTLENVCGFWPGSDPELSREVLILSAHYDHVGVNDGVVYNGADDNGSGTVGLLAVADALVAHGPLARSVLLIWVSGEEKGLYGSRAWVNSPWLPEGHRAVANINIDMIGRNDPDQLLVTPTKERANEYGVLSRAVEEFAPLEGFTRLDSADAYYQRSDQAMFAQMGIPVVFLFTDVHDDYHQPTDTHDKIDYDKLTRVVRVVLRLLDRVQGGALTTE